MMLPPPYHPSPLGADNLCCYRRLLTWGGYPPGRYHASRREGWYYRGAIVILAWYRTDTEMTPQERSLIALSMPGAKHQRGHRLTVCSEGGFVAAVFRQGDLRLSSGKALKKTNSVRVLSNFALVIAPPFAPGGYLTPTLRGLILVHR